LIIEFPGVYRVGHRAPSLAAAWLWGLVKGPAPPPEVTAPTERRIKGIKPRRQRRIDRRDATRHRGIPVTTVPATLVRLPSLLSFDDLAKAAHEAAVRHGTTPEQIEAAQARQPKAPGAKLLRAIVRGDAPTLLGAASARDCAEQGCRCRAPTARTVPTTSTAAGQSTS
jgi:hypothetical protein